MMPPYERYPFVSPYQTTMPTPHSHIFPEGEYYQQYAQPSPYYPAQASYESYEAAGDYGTEPIPRVPGDPPPVLSNNPVRANISLFKELTGFPNYGNPSRNADILYTGNQGTWTFDSPAFLVVPGNQRAQLVIRAVLDDHVNVPVNRYSARITINGSIVHNGRLALQHGSPAGGMFINWRDLTFNMPSLRRSNRVSIVNTSNVGPNDWIAFDWMEIRLLPR